MNTTAIRTKVAEYISFGFTMSEAFENIKDAARVRSRKTNVVAEARAAAAERTGVEQLSWADVKFGKR
jgi:hypothetical protein